ncbi:MAG: gamma carbonic anhydrase family protein [Candidatus Altiarchaeota archaeon]
MTKSIHPSVYLAPGAQVIGKVAIGKDSSIWHNAVLRGDFAGITVGQETSIQDCAVVHSEPDKPTFIGDRVSVGHGAVIHCATLSDECLIGMNATVLDKAVIGKHSIVGAGAVVSGDRKHPENSLLLGVPAKVIREVTESEIRYIKENAQTYIELAKEYKNKEK